MNFKYIKTNKNIIGKILKNQSKKLITTIVINFILIIIIFFNFCEGQEFLISDYDFTNQNYTMQSIFKFTRNFKNCALNYSEVETVVRYSHLYKINPIAVFAKMQMESDIVQRVSHREGITDFYLKERAMGYALNQNFRRDGLKFYKYGGYDIQVYFAIKRFRELFDEYKKGNKKYIIDLKKEIIPENASTWALYRYTPFYGEHNVYNWDYGAIGNKAFKIIFEKYKIIYDKIKNGKI